MYLSPAQRGDQGIMVLIGLMLILILSPLVPDYISGRIEHFCEENLEISLKFLETSPDTALLSDDRIVVYRFGTPPDTLYYEGCIGGYCGAELGTPVKEGN